MNPPLEDALFSAQDRREFLDACRNAFSGASGVILKNALLRIAHPFYPPVGPDTHSTYRQIGRAEVVNLLLRYSDVAVEPKDFINLPTK